MNEPKVIGARDDKDIIEIMDKINDDRSSGDEEDNDEGMGDIDIEEDGEGEERKEDKKPKKSKKAKDSDDEDEEDNEDDDLWGILVDLIR